MDRVPPSGDNHTFHQVHENGVVPGVPEEEHRQTSVAELVQQLKEIFYSDDNAEEGGI